MFKIARKIKVFIINRDNSIIINKIKNPNSENDLSYKLNGEKVTKKYVFDSACVFEAKIFLFKQKIIMYQEGKLEPLKCDFKSDNLTSKAITDIMETTLFKQLNDSVKKPLIPAEAIPIIVICVIVFIGYILFKSYGA